VRRCERGLRASEKGSPTAEGFRSESAARAFPGQRGDDEFFRAVDCGCSSIEDARMRIEEEGPALSGRRRSRFIDGVRLGGILPGRSLDSAGCAVSSGIAGVAAPWCGSAGVSGRSPARGTQRTKWWVGLRLPTYRARSVNDGRLPVRHHDGVGGRYVGHRLDVPLAEIEPAGPRLLVEGRRPEKRKRLANLKRLERRPEFRDFPGAPASPGG